MTFLAAALPAIIGAGASIGGNLLGAQSNARAARLNAIYQGVQAQNAAAMQDAQFRSSQSQANKQYATSFKESRRQFSVSQSVANKQWLQSLRSADKDRALQREFAQNGVQWRVADAQASGIHPLAALGAQLQSSSPIQISGNVPSGSVPTGHAPSANPVPYSTGSPFTGMGAAYANMGQDISRAVTSVATEYERNSAVAQASQALSLENQKLQNQYLASQIAKNTGASVGPPMPSVRSTQMMAGQGNTPSKLVDIQPHKPVANFPGREDAEPGQITDTGFAATRTGWAPVPSKDVKERIEDNLISELMWEARNRVLQSLQITQSGPAHIKIPEGKEMWFNPFQQEYQLRSKTFLKDTFDRMNRGVDKRSFSLR
ncbi:DNA pilot protein [robinz microvirus RP_139]|nr:DNA pilot protein [robinz microvirus RP_139]